MSFLKFKDEDNSIVCVNKNYVVCLEENRYASFPTDYRIYVALSKKSYRVSKETYDEIRKALKISET